MAARRSGIVFSDPGFHIAVLGALVDAELFDEERIERALDGVDGDDDDERLLAAMARLHAIKLDRADVAGIEALDFDGGNEVYMLLEEGAGVDTGGEEDTYALRSLDGIDALGGLKRLNLDGHGYCREGLDLQPLASHPALESLLLTGDCAGAKVLETLPKLAKLNVQYATLDDGAVLDRLAARGVEIKRKV